MVSSGDCGVDGRKEEGREDREVSRERERKEQ